MLKAVDLFTGDKLTLSNEMFYARLALIYNLSLEKLKSFISLKIRSSFSCRRQARQPG